MNNNTAFLYQVRQVQEIEQLAIKTYHISSESLMERAGEAAFRELKNQWPDAKHITVVTGKGNNAGDGYVVARLAQLSGIKVRILSLVPLNNLQEAAKIAFEKCGTAGVKIEEFSIEKLREDADVIVDAILGTGLQGGVREPFYSAIAAINKLGRPVLSIDLPSGLDADFGSVLGIAVDADLTVTFIGNKLGLFTASGLDYCGRVVVDDLAIPHEAFTKIRPIVQFLDLVKLKKLFPERKATAHKGDFGHVLLIGGNYGMAGSIRMAAEAAVRVGAGMVTVATREEHVAMVNCARPEIMCHGIHSPRQMRSLTERASVIVIGPGLAQTHWSNCVLKVALASKKPMVVDADGLNLLALNYCHRDNWILTPHPGEAARLLQTDTSSIQVDRLDAVLKIQQKYGGVCVLKGAGTLVAYNNHLTGLCRAGNPGMASGGMGDVLSGIIGGVLAQGLALDAAANFGVVLHSMAADEAAKEQGMRGLLAMDLIPYVRRLLNC